MGQYFKYAKSDASEGFQPDWIKCMEHSYVGNFSTFLYAMLLTDSDSNLAAMITRCLQKRFSVNHEALQQIIGRWALQKTQHAGDYADADPDFGENVYERISGGMSDDMWKLFRSALGLTSNLNDIRFAAFNEEEAKKLIAVTDDVYLRGAPIFVLNHELKLALDLRAATVIQRTLFNQEELFIDPLSILMVRTDSGGGGDYHGSNMDAVGSWANHPISISSLLPDDFDRVIYFFREGAGVDGFEMDALIKKEAVNEALERLKDHEAELDEAAALFAIAGLESSFDELADAFKLLVIDGVA